jgi:hypothetical protein
MKINFTPIRTTVLGAILVIIASIFTGVSLRSQAVMTLDRLIVGGEGASTLSYIRAYSVTFDAASIAANTTAVQTVTSAATRAAIGDKVIVNPRAVVGAGAGIDECFVSAADTVRCVYANNTAAAVDPASATYDIIVIRNR